MVCYWWLVSFGFKMEWWVGKGELGDNMGIGGFFMFVLFVVLIVFLVVVLVV